MVIIERSVLSCQHVFIKYGITHGTINEQENVLLTNKIKQINLKPDLHILLDLSYQTCLRRIIRRDRECERGLQIDYIRKLHEYHQIMAQQFNLTLINAEHNQSYIRNAFSKWLKQ